MPMRHSRHFRPIVVVVSGFMLLSACAVPPNGQATGPMTPEQQQLHASNNRFRSTVAEAAVLGTVLGAGLGYLTGGAKGALIGAGAGLATGAAAGYLVAQNNYAQSRTEQNYQAAIADARSQANAFGHDAALSEAVASEATAKAGQLDAQYRAHTISAAQYSQNFASYNQSIRDLDEKNAAAAKQLDALRKSIAVSTPAQAAPLQDAARSIELDMSRMAAAKEHLRQVTLSGPTA